jgi:hypothetical protein
MLTAAEEMMQLSRRLLQLPMRQGRIAVHSKPPFSDPLGTEVSQQATASLDHCAKLKIYFYKPLLPFMLRFLCID